MQFEARFFDGTSLEAVHVVCLLESGRLILKTQGGQTLSAHPVADIHLLYADRLGNRVDLGFVGLKDHRLMVEALRIRSALGRYLPQVLEEPGGHGWGAAFKVSIALFGFVAFLSLIVWQLDKVLPTFVPEGYARDFGKNLADEYIDLFGGTCEVPEGADALNTLTARLTDGYSPGQPLTVRVADSGIVNAFALPGGQIVLFRGLLDKAASPDEVAGVMAHEMGHVKHKHSLRGLTRALGIGIVASLFTGSNVSDLAQHAVAMSFSRDAEREADSEALIILDTAAIDTAPLAGFFDRLSKEYDDNKAGVFTFFSSHPASGERARIIERHDGAMNIVPALTESEWLALKAICPAKAEKEEE